MFDSNGRLWNKPMSRSARRKVAEISSHQDKKETAMKLTKVVKTSAEAYPLVQSNDQEIEELA